MRKIILTPLSNYNYIFIYLFLSSSSSTLKEYMCNVKKLVHVMLKKNRGNL